MRYCLLPCLALVITLAACARQTPAPVVVSGGTAPRALTRPATQEGWQAEGYDIKQRPSVTTGGELPAAIPRLKTALLVPLSGAQADLGRRLLDAATLAVFDNASSQTSSQTLSLNPYDTGDSPAGAAAAARKAVDDGAGLILGPVFAPQVRAVQPEAARQNVPVVAFSNDAGVAGQNVYVLGYQPRDQVQRIMGYALNRGYDRFAVLVPQGPYGDAVLAAARDMTRTTAARILTVETFAPDIDSMTAALKRLAVLAPALPPETGGATAPVQNDPDRFNALLIPVGGKMLQSLASMLPYYNVDIRQVRLLGTVQWQDTATFGDPALRGGWFPAPPPAARQAFVTRYETTTGKPPAALESLAYDATALAAALADSGGEGVSAATLTNPNGFVGVDGVFRFTANQTAERGFAVLEVRDGEFYELDAAPTQFFGAGL
jgi:branched-chain amino acid transport system substrate-binding protein